MCVWVSFLLNSIANNRTKNCVEIHRQNLNQKKNPIKHMPMSLYPMHSFRVKPSKTQTFVWCLHIIHVIFICTNSLLFFQEISECISIPIFVNGNFVTSISKPSQFSFVSIPIYSILFVNFILFFFLVARVHMNCACGKLLRLNACGGCRQHGMTMKIGCGMRVNTQQSIEHTKHTTMEQWNTYTHWRRYLEQKYRVQAHGLDAQYVFFFCKQYKVVFFYIFDLC